ncbi:Hsp20/alpha crystallin family protein [Snuella lapsa]|uniref:Hsp20/alpha crystallin family protein n=1 Tax=Snuella lapsa TaxID=870481 RepID=A0ABP6X7C3_9FLAO
MTLIKFNNRNRLFPWSNSGLKSFLSSDDFFNDDFFVEDSLMPEMNIKEHENDFEVEFAAPGFSKKDFEITINDSMLSVSAEKQHETEEKEEDYIRKEFSYDAFKRSLRLPDNVDPENKVNATYKNGILRLNLLKKKERQAPPKKVIEVI